MCFKISVGVSEWIEHNITMDARVIFLRKFRDFVDNPCLDGAKSLKDALTEDALRIIHSTEQTDYFLAPLLTLITEVEAR